MTVELDIYSQYTSVNNIRSKIFSELYKHMSIPYPSFWFMKSYRNGWSDGRYHFLNKYMRNFPTGILQHAEKFFIENRIDYKLNDHRKIIDVEKYKKLTLKGVSLRDYQKEAIDEIIDKKCLILNFATNAGKTEVGIAAIKIFLKNDLKILWLIHRVPLMFQTQDRMAERLEISKEDIGIIGAGKWDISKQLTISTIQTLSKSIKKKETKDFLNSIDCVFVDEVHHGSSSSYFSTLMKIPATYRIGFSGTAILKDELSNMKIMAAIGMDVIYISNDYLISRGLSAIPIIYFHMIENPVLDKDLDYGDLLKYKRDEFGECIEEKSKNLIAECDSEGNPIIEKKGVYRLGVIENEMLNDRIAQITCQSIEKGSVLILVSRIEHGIILKDKIKLKKQNTEFIHGSTDPDELTKIITQFKNGDLKVLIASTIFDEGMDIPRIRTLILAAQGCSSIKLLQRIGRGLRRKEEDNYLDVHDFIICCHEYLLNHSKSRLEDYHKEKFKIIDMDS